MVLKAGKLAIKVVGVIISYLNFFKYGWLQKKFL